MLLAVASVSSRHSEDSLLPWPWYGTVPIQIDSIRSLTEALGSFQRLMDKIMHGLPCVITYINDVLVYSKNMKDHKCHLQQIFHRLSEAG